MQDSPVKTREELFREKAEKFTVCFSQVCPLKEHCLRSILTDYVPETLVSNSCINLRNPQMQRLDCPKLCKDDLVRMPLGISRMYYDMPGHLERSIKNRLISIFSRRRYYDFHCGRRPVTPDEEQVIRKTLLNFGWEKEPVFNGYIEDYLW